jgi:hypothetical protein
MLKLILIKDFLLMAYRDNESRNRRDRERRRESKTASAPKPVKRCQQTFADWCEILPQTIRTKDYDVFYLDVRLGPLTLPDTRFDSRNGSWFPTTATMDPAKRPRMKPAWYVGTLRPLIVAAIEKKYDLTLAAFDEEEADDDGVNDDAVTSAQKSVAQKTGQAVLIMPEPVAEIDPNVVCRGLLSANPGIGSALLAKLAEDQGVSRKFSRQWVQLNVTAGSIAVKEPGGDEPTEHYLVGETVPPDMPFAVASEPAAKVRPRVASPSRPLPPVKMWS